MTTCWLCGSHWHIFCERGIIRDGIVYILVDGCECPLKQAGELIYEPLWSWGEDLFTSPSALIRLMVDGKWGFVDFFSGNIVIEPIWDYVEPFVHGYSLVVSGGYCGVEDEQFQKQIIEHINPVSGGKKGIIDIDGYIVIPSEYDAIELPDDNYSWGLGNPFEDRENRYKESCFKVSQRLADSVKWGVVNDENQPVIPVEWDYLEFGPRVVLAGIAMNTESEYGASGSYKWSIYDHTFSQIIGPELDAKPEYCDERYCLIEKAGRFGVLDGFGTCIAAPDLSREDARSLIKSYRGESTEMVEQNPGSQPEVMNAGQAPDWMRVGYTPKSRMIIQPGSIPCKFQVTHEKIGVIEGDTIYRFDQEGGKHVLQIPPFIGWPDSPTLIEFWIEYDESHMARPLDELCEGGAGLDEGILKYGLVNSNDGKIAVPAVYDYIDSLYDGYARIQKDGLWGIIDDKGIVIIEPLWDDIAGDPFQRSGLTAVTKGTLSGYIDKSGAVIIEPQYEYAEDFVLVSPDSYVARVMKGGKWGLINDRGNNITGFIFDEIASFWPPAGCYPVRESGKWGFIGPDGLMLVPFIFVEVGEAGSFEIQGPEENECCEFCFHTGKMEEVWGILDSELNTYMSQGSNKYVLHEGMKIYIGRNGRVRKIRAVQGRELLLSLYEGNPDNY